jgi:anion-transporting  ArsA/GET3 family ATPase
VRDLFRDASQTEFIIATIPTVMAAAESQRLLKELKEEGVPCHRIVVNQLLPPVDGPLDTDVSCGQFELLLLLVP